MFKPNRSLNKVIDKLLDDSDLNPLQKCAVRFRLFTMTLFRRRKLEKALSEEAMRTGAIPLEASDGDGIFQGNWEDVLDWIWEHRNEILEMILTIISLF